MNTNFILSVNAFVVIVVVGPALVYAVMFGLGFGYGYVTITGDEYAMDVSGDWIRQPDGAPTNALASAIMDGIYEGVLYRTTTRGG